MIGRACLTCTSNLPSMDESWRLLEQCLFQTSSICEVLAFLGRVACFCVRYIEKYLLLPNLYESFFFFRSNHLSWLCGRKLEAAVGVPQGVMPATEPIHQSCSPAVSRAPQHSPHSMGFRQPPTLCNAGLSISYHPSGLLAIIIATLCFIAGFAALVTGSCNAALKKSRIACVFYWWWEKGVGV